MNRKFIIIFTVMVLVLSVLAGCKSRRDRSYELTDEAYQEYWGTDWNAVIRLTTDAIKVDPEFPWPYSMRGAAYNAKKQYALAIADLTKAIELAPDFAPAFINRGISNMYLERYKEAGMDLREALKLAPRDLNAIVSMAELFSATGAVEQSCEYMKRAMQRGFRDMGVLEERKNFENLVFSDCYYELQDLAAESPGGRP